MQYRIGIVADLLGISPEGLRLYERSGILAAQREAGGSYRCVYETDIPQQNSFFHTLPPPPLGRSSASSAEILPVRFSHASICASLSLSLIHIWV